MKHTETPYGRTEYFEGTQADSTMHGQQMHGGQRPTYPPQAAHVENNGRTVYLKKLPPGNKSALIAAIVHHTRLKDYAVVRQLKRTDCGKKGRFIFSSAKKARRMAEDLQRRGVEVEVGKAPIGWRIFMGFCIAFDAAVALYIVAMFILFLVKTLG